MRKFDDLDSPLADQLALELGRSAPLQFIASQSELSTTGQKRQKTTTPKPVWHGWKPGNAALPTTSECGKTTSRQGSATPGYARP
jgi:hypothetical protein